LSIVLKKYLFILLTRKTAKRNSLSHAAIPPTSK
jgi:hypothetical protein